MQISTQTTQNVTVQSGRPSSRISISEEAQQDVRKAYLVSQRQRFKTEINRLTSGAMLRMLEDKTTAGDDAAKLSFLMSYVFAWNWLQQNDIPIAKWVKKMAIDKILLTGGPNKGLPFGRLEPCDGKLHARFLGGLGLATAPGYPVS